VWRNIRSAILLLFLGIAAYSNWYDRLSTTDWDETLYIGVFPLDDSDNEVAHDYIAHLTPDRIADIEQFLKLNLLATTSEKDEQQGYRFVFAGGMNTPAAN
jgi:hypothetical protein